MNSLLSFLQNHYAHQPTSVVLGDPPEISDDDFIGLSENHAREVAHWVVQQTWEADVDYVYEHIRYLGSPGLKLLDRLAKHGHADTICGVYEPSLSGTNQVLLAHCLQVARNAYGVNEDRARSVILSCVDHGDPTLVSQNFVIWMNDWRVATRAVKLLKNNNCSMKEALLDIDDRVNNSLVHGVWDNDNTQMSQWVSSFLYDIEFSDLLGSMSGALEFVNDMEPSRSPFVEQKIQEMLSGCSLECAKAYVAKAVDPVFVDRLLPLFPERFKYELAHEPIVEHTPNAQHIRAHGTVYEAVAGYGGSPFSKKL